MDFWKKVNLSDLKEKLKNVRFLTDEEVDKIEKKYASKWKEHYPQLSRDHGAEILNLVNNGADRLIDHSSFAGGIGCQYCYIIDLDENVFESYSSSYGNPRDVENVGRFKNMYLMKSYKLDELPTEKEYLDYLEPSNDED